jgi:prepilin-type N-terminal cleavage/methylation domain-containing protein
MFKHKQNDSGFTILEVIVALVIVGISVTTFVRLLGNSSMLRAKVNDYDERLDVAILKTEQTFLGVIEGFSAQGSGKNVLSGKIADRDINWRIEIEGENDDSSNARGRDVRFYTVSVDGIDISSVGFR